MSNQELRSQFVRALESGDVEAARGIWNRNRGVVESVIPLDRYIEVAAERDDVPMIEALVGFGARIDPNISDENEPEGPIFAASSEGAVNAVRWLLDRGATINHVVKGQRRCLSLTTAAVGGHLDVVKLLVEHGADVSAVWMGQNALSAAMTYGRTEVADYLRSKGAILPAELKIESTLKTESTAAAPSRQELLLQHITDQIGTPQPLLLQEIIPSDPRVTIHLVECENSCALVTTGMSDRPMAVPEGMEQFRFAELMIKLPLYWQFDEASLNDPTYFWPIEWLRYIALYPHQNNTWLGGNVTIFANDEPPRPLASNTDLSCILALAGADCQPLVLPNGEQIMFYSLYPLYAEERDLEKAQGTDALLERFVEYNISRVVNPERPNVATLASRS